MKRLSGLLFLLGLAVFAGLILLLERPTGTVTGQIFAANGGPLAGATVTLDEYPVARKAISDEKGNFKLELLPVGSYYASVSRKGYQAKYLQEKKIGEGERLDLGRIDLDEMAPSLNVNVWNETKTPDEKVFISASGAKVNSIQFKAYKVDLAAFFGSGKKIEDLTNSNDLPAGLGDPIKTWQETIPEEDVPEFDKKFKVDLPGAGAYLIHSEAASLDRSNFFNRNILINKTDVAFITKRDSGQVLVYVAGLIQGQPIEGASVSLIPPQGQALQATTNAEGLATFPSSDLAAAESLMIAVHQGEAWAYAPAPALDQGDMVADEEGGEGEEEGDPAAVPAGSRYQTFIYTERPLYRPGQKVYFKGIARLMDRDGNYSVPPAGNVSLSVEDPKGNTFWNQEKQGSAGGTFWDELDLPEEADLGYYRIKAVVGGQEFTEEFEVDEYRKPEFKVEITPDKPRYFAGEKIKFLVSTQYYFGAPVEAELSYTVYRSTYYYFTPGEELPEWLGEDESYGGYGDYVSEGKAKTDRTGHVAIDVPTGTDSGSDERYILRLTATDVTNRTVTTENYATVTAGDFFFRTETDQFLAFPGKPYPLTVVTKDYDGKPVAGQGFEVKIEREVWDRVAQSYDYKKESSLDGKTGANGEAPLQLQFKRGGYYSVSIEGKDKGGRHVSYQDYVWVSGNAEDSEEFSYQKQLKLVVDHKKFNAGESAKLFIVGPVKNGRVLLTIEGPKILQYQVVTLDGFSKQVDLPLKQEWIPNVYVSAALIGNKEYYEGSVEFQISPKEHYLTVDIKPDAEIYRPAGTINYTIITKGADGQPAAAELSLGVVDESLYALKADSTNIKSFFWGPRPNRVSSNYSFSGYYSGGVEKEDQNQLRRNFKDTAYWAPMLQTSPDGQATASFALPDNLTTWRATVVAATADTAVGQQINKVISSKDLIVRLATPRFFTERDTVTLKAIVHNYTDKPQALQVSLGAEGVDFASAKDGENRSLTIEPKGVQSFDFTLLPKMAGTAKLQLLAKNAAVSDGIELKIPVLPHGIADHQYAQGEVEGSNSVNVPLKVLPQSDPQRAKLKLTLDTSFVAQLLGSLSYLVDYPYGCVEQTMSRLLPAITVSKLYESLGLSDPMLDKKLPKVIAKGLKRIVSFQHSDGGWGWWKQDNTDPYMTAYAMYGLIRAKQLGATVEDSVIENGKEALKNLLKNGATQTNIYMLGSEATTYFIHYVASLAGIENAAPQPRASGFNDRMAESMLVLALHAQGKNDEADYWRRDLEKSLVCQNSLCHIPAGANASRYYDDAETTAWGLLAVLSGANPDPILKDGMARWLLTQRRGGLWRHTRATATVLYALSEYAQGLPGVKSGVNATLSLNGEFLEKIAVAAAHFVRNVQQPKLKTGNNSLEVGNLLTTPLYYQSDLTTFSQQENLAATTQGIRVRREYVSLGDVTEDSAGSRTFKVDALKGKLKTGQIIGVRLTVESDEDLAYVVIEDPFPSGFEVVDGITFDTPVEYYAEFEKRDEKIAFFANYLQKGKHVYNYALRPELKGSFHAMPTEASEMYRPEMRGSGAENVLEVE